jgi:hypothetical protein
MTAAREHVRYKDIIRLMNRIRRAFRQPLLSIHHSAFAITNREIRHSPAPAPLQPSSAPARIDPAAASL